MDAAEWTAAFGPFDDGATRSRSTRSSMTKAIRDGRPAHGDFCIRTPNAGAPIEAAAFPIVASGRAPRRDDHVLAARERLGGTRPRGGKGLGRARIGAGPRAGDEPLRGQHLVHAGHVRERRAS